MKLVLRRAGECATLIGAVLLGTMSAGCTDEQTSFYIQGNVKVDPPQCLARPESNSTILLVGGLDVALRRGYQAILLVGSQLAPRGDKTNLRTETMVATITGAEVHLYDDVGTLVDDPFTVPATGVIPPDSSDGPGFGVISATLIPASFGTALLMGTDGQEALAYRESRTFVAEVIVFGKTIGGLDVESSQFSYVIQVCKGCIVDFPADALALDLTTGLPSCGPSDQAPVPPCGVGQDDPVDCRICAGSGNPYCVYPYDSNAVP
jgi:hypothetical protein